MEKKPAHANGASLKAFYPQGTQWDAKLKTEDLVTMFDAAIAKYGDKPCLDFYGVKLNYKQVGAMVDKAAKGFQAQGIGKGNKVGLCMPNSPYYPVMMFAALKTGATVVNYNPEYTEDKLEHLIKDSQTDIMVMLDLKALGPDKPYYAKLKNLADNGTLKKLIVCPMGKMMPAMLGFGYKLTKQKWFAASGRNVVSFAALTNNDGRPEKASIGKDDLAVLQYTGGTTGLPKGAMLSHYNLAANAAQIENFFGRGPGKPDSDALLAQGEEKVMAVLPFFHVFGLQISMITSMNLGAEIIIVPNPRDLDHVLGTIQRTKATLLPSVPKLLQGVSEFKNTHKYDLTSLRLAVSGGAALPSNVKASFEKSAGCAIKQGYGLSETAPVASAEAPYGDTDPASIGLAVPGTEIKIINPDTMKTLNIGEMGEICIKGPQVMKGYFNDVAETAKVMTPDGFFRSGDLGIMSDKMEVTITDRLKRLIIINGFNVYPFQVEKEVVKHPAVAECCVVKVPDARSGEAAKAFIRYLPDAKDKPDAAAMKAFLKDKLDDVAMPKHIEIWEEELPKTDIGKPDFKRLEEMERAKYDAAQKQDKGPGPNAP